MYSWIETIEIDLMIVYLRIDGVLALMRKWRIDVIMRVKYWFVGYWGKFDLLIRGVGPKVPLKKRSVLRVKDNRLLLLGVLNMWWLRWSMFDRASLPLRHNLWNGTG